MGSVTSKAAEAAVLQVLQDWYEALSAHRPFESFRHLLTEDAQLDYAVPARQDLSGRQQFSAWYEETLNRHFDELHALQNPEVRIEGARATVDASVRWEVRTWKPRAAQSDYRSYQTRQRFELALQSDGRWAISRKATVDTQDVTPE
jgi:ketosteroid isomerase-like protein